MENFTFTVYFHAENREDALNQVSGVLDNFDDGYERAVLSSEEIEGAVLESRPPNFGWEVKAAPHSTTRKFQVWNWPTFLGCVVVPADSKDALAEAERRASDRYGIFTELREL